MKTYFASLLLSTPLLAGLPAVGPDYQQPSAPSTPSYRDAADGSTLTLQSEWWLAFNDPVLADLETRALSANQDLRIAVARVEQARAIAGVARADYLPSLAVEPSLSRDRGSRNVGNALPVATTTTYRVPLALSWELDLFGRVRRLNESARAELAAAGATFDAARLDADAHLVGR